MLTKKIAVLAMTGASLMLASTAQADALKDIQKRGTIVVGVDIGAPPSGMVDGDAKQTGFDIDSAKLLAKDLGVKLEVVPVTADTGAVPAPQSGGRAHGVVLDSGRAQKSHRLFRTLWRCACGFRWAHGVQRRLAPN